MAIYWILHKYWDKGGKENFGHQHCINLQILVKVKACSGKTVFIRNQQPKIHLHKSKKAIKQMRVQTAGRQK